MLRASDDSRIVQNPEESLKKLALFIPVAAAGLCCLASAQGHAASGTVELVISTVVNAYPVRMGDTIVTASGGAGTLKVVRGSGRPFEDGASATVHYAGFSKQTPSGLDLEMDGLATFSPEDTLLLVFERKPEDPGLSSEGTLHLADGSGRFSGVSGICKYKSEEQAGNANVTVAKCEWVYSFPYR